MTRRKLHDCGFSLVEVLVALVVVSVGLLGLAKMQSVALASTTVSGARSIVAIQAASLAAMMHANPDYWQSAAVQQPTTVTSSSNPYAGTAPCTTAGTSACSPTQMAHYDIEQWGVAMGYVLPLYVANITCGLVTGTKSYSCVIQIQWPENAVAMDAEQANSGFLEKLNAATNNMVQYTLYVQP